MNKKILSLTVAAAVTLAFASCTNEEDDLFDQSAVERLEASQKTFTERLAAGSGEWTMEYYLSTVDTKPTSYSEEYKGVGYVMLAKFGSDNIVKVGMNNIFSNNVYTEDSSCWEVVEDQGLVLSFNTYNKCIHAFASPDDLPFTTPSSQYDETGIGAEGDYEFIIMDLEEDAQTATLKGKKRGTYMHMTRLPEGTDFEEYIADLATFKNSLFPSDMPNKCILTMGDSVMVVDSICKNYPNIYPYGKDDVAYGSLNPYTITKHDGKYHLRFRDAITGNDDATEQEFIYDEAEDVFKGETNEANVLKGENPVNFFSTTLDDGIGWIIINNNVKKDVSESLNTLYANMESEFGSSANKYKIKSIELTTASDGNASLSISVSYKRNGNSYSLTFKYTFALSVADENITLTYIGPNAETPYAETMTSRYASLVSFLNALSDTYTVNGKETNFYLKNIHLNSVTDSNKWLNITRK